MRKLVVSEFVSLDGVMEDPGGAEDFAHGGWTFQFPDPEGMSFKLDEIRTHDALLLGRVTYQGFAAAWPSVTDEVGFADKMNGMPKYVVSTTLDKLEWNNSTLIKDNVLERVRELKESSARGRPRRRVPPDGVSDRAGQRQATVRREHRRLAADARRLAGPRHRDAHPHLPHGLTPDPAWRVGSPECSSRSRTSPIRRARSRSRRSLSAFGSAGTTASSWSGGTG